MLAFGDFAIPDVWLFLSRDGKVFRKCLWGTGRGDAWIMRGTEKLAPLASKRYDLYVLYEWASESRMAFDTPGAYWVKARFPLGVRTPQGHHRSNPIMSNVLQIEIKQPQGLDATAYETLRRPELLCFLQTPSLEPGRKKAAVEAARLYQSTRGSTYDPPLRRSLEEYYHARWKFMGGFKPAQADPDMAEIRGALGIFDPLPGPFPDDARLDQEIIYHYPEATPFWQVCAQASSATDVPLSVAPELAGRTKTSVRLKRSLREFMAGMDHRDSQWVPHGKGYMLVPASEALPAAVRERLERKK